jgi:hypothetical protein
MNARNDRSLAIAQDHWRIREPIATHLESQVALVEIEGASHCTVQNVMWSGLELSLTIATHLADCGMAITTERHHVFGSEVRLFIVGQDVVVLDVRMPTANAPKACLLTKGALDVRRRVGAPLIACHELARSAALERTHLHDLSGRCKAAAS